LIIYTLLDTDHQDMDGQDRAWRGDIDVLLVLEIRYARIRSCH